LIDPRAVVDPKAELADRVSIGAFAIIGPEVSIDVGSWVGPHCVLQGRTHVGRDNQIFQFASVGERPQDKKYRGERTELVIGDRNVIREYCSLHRGTALDRGKTVIGDDNWIMAYVHVAHDCVIGSHTVLANGTSLAGHVQIDDHATLGGFTLLHQFCHVGAHAFSAMGTAVSRDVPPYMTVAGNPARPRGINLEGLRRHGFSAESLARLRRAYKILYRSGLRLEEAIEALELEGSHVELQELTRFLRSSRRSVVR